MGWMTKAQVLAWRRGFEEAERATLAMRMPRARRSRRPASSTNWRVRKDYCRHPRTLFAATRTSVPARFGRGFARGSAVPGRVDRPLAEALRALAAALAALPTQGMVIGGLRRPAAPRPATGGDATPERIGTGMSRRIR